MMSEARISGALGARVGCWDVGLIKAIKAEFGTMAPWHYSNSNMVLRYLGTMDGSLRTMVW